MAVPPKGESSQIDQLRHRINLISSWENGGASFKGAQIIDIGCGQGDQTVALLGIEEVITVVGIDPGPPDYGEAKRELTRIVLSNATSSQAAPLL